MLPAADRASGGVVAPPRGPSGNAVRVAQIHGVTVRLGSSRSTLEVGVLGGFGAALCPHGQRRLGHARWKWGRCTFTIRKD